MKKRCTGFTLVEILVVLAIIAILAAFLFPAFGRARESSRQANCQSNLQQISLAVQQYRKEEGRYPDSLLDLLGEGAKFIEVDGTTLNTLSGNAPGYLRAGLDSLVCQDDDTDSDKPRSSYGKLTKAGVTLALPAVKDQAGFESFAGDYSNYVWNYWGTREDGYAFRNADEAAAASWPASVTTKPATSILLVNPDAPYSYPSNVIKYSMSNRFAPPGTIITHCVYHRLPTANNLTSPGELYIGDASNSTNAQEIIATVEPKAKKADVSNWLDQKTWQIQTQ